MKLTKSQLQKLIQEELDILMNEDGEEEPKSCEELEEELRMIQRDIHTTDPMDSAIPSMFGHEGRLKLELKDCLAKRKG